MRENPRDVKSQKKINEKGVHKHLKNTNQAKK